MPEWTRRTHFLVALTITTLLRCGAVGEERSGDWPMWRYDPYRSAAASENELPASLNLLWTKTLSARQQTWDDPLNLDLMTYDRVFEPIVMDGRLFVGFNDKDKLTAFDADSGEEIWTVYADAPVRLPPVGWEGRVFFCSDDGYLYCVDAESGDLHWKYSGAPSSQRAIGNRRITSAWPARGGPVVRDGKVYFAASIWPFMGTFVYAIDANTGKVVWINDSTGSQFIKQPHSAPSFAGVAPQGALVATNDTLLVPGGRSVPAAFDRQDGTLKYFEINAGGKGTGGSFLSADEQHFYVHTREKGTRAFNLQNGIKTAFMPSEPVLHNGQIYSAEVEKDKHVVRCYSSDQKVVWEVAADGSKDLILAGDRLFAAGSEGITIIQLHDNKPGTIQESIATTQPVERLIAADRKLFAVTMDGNIMAFGQGKPRTPATKNPIAQGSNVTDEAKRIAKDLLSIGNAEGYAFWFGRSDTAVAQAVYEASEFVQLAVIDNNNDAVRRMRRLLDGEQRYGRVTVHHGKAGSFQGPKYVANMVLFDLNSQPSFNPTHISKVYESVRPYGGILHLLTSGDRKQLASEVIALELEQASVEVGPHGVVVMREGALPGSADWTHQYGDIANTIKSNDSRVKLPLGVLWFGGSSNMDVLPRHGHGPPEQVIGGRLFIQGMNSISARDVYTGRVLWIREFEDLGTFDVYYDKTFEDTPLNTKYNQVHIPGANGRGTNYVVTEDRVYVVEGPVCHVIDPATGKTLTDIRLPKLDENSKEETEAEHWGYIGVYRDTLIGGLGFANYRKRDGVSLESDKDLKDTKAGFGSKSFDRAASEALVGFDRHSGKVLWKTKANHSFWHNGVIAGGNQVFCLDRNPAPLEDIMRRRGIAKPDTYRIIALDHRTGKLNWELTEGVFGTWLGYSEKHNLLLQAGASGSDRLVGEVSKGMAVYSATDGSVKWKKESLKYTGPCILHNDLIITNTNSYAESAGAFYLTDGRQKEVRNPLTGEMQPWKLTRAYGCNNIIASENLLTFRSGAAGFYDLLTNAGTGNLGGFKSGCTSNLVVAGGVLNAPDYTRTCSCAYQNQTSLALVHMPEVELWSVNSAASVQAKGNRIESVGLNFGAPGDRRDANGLLWLEYPATAGPSPPLSVEFNDEANFYQRHSSAAAEGELPWVQASGVENVTDLRIGLTVPDGSDLRTGVPINHASDDAEETAKGKVSLTGSSYKLVKSKGQVVGIRFNNIQLKRDSKIREAYVQFTCAEPSGGTARWIFAAEDVGNAKRFEGKTKNLSSRKRTKETVQWSPPDWPNSWQSGSAHRTPNLAPLIEAVVGRKDWKPGNSIVLLISGTGTRSTMAWNKTGGQTARLVVDSDGIISQSNDGESVKPEPYNIRMLFGATEHLDNGDRVFDVYVQDKLVRKNLTLEDVEENGNAGNSLELQNLSVGEDLHIRFVPKVGNVVLSGIELVRQNSQQ